MSTDVQVEISIGMIDEHPQVYCWIEHFVSSGKTAIELLSALRPTLLAQVQRAIALDPNSPKQRSTSVFGVDLISKDPLIDFRICDPRQFITNIDAEFDRLRRGIESSVRTNIGVLSGGVRHA